MLHFYRFCSVHHIHRLSIFSARCTILRYIRWMRMFLVRCPARTVHTFSYRCTKGHFIRVYKADCYLTIHFCTLYLSAVWNGLAWFLHWLSNMRENPRSWFVRRYAFTRRKKPTRTPFWNRGGHLLTVFYPRSVHGRTGSKSRQIMICVLVI